jgi:hypothetical protein
MAIANHVAWPSLSRPVRRRIIPRVIGLRVMSVKLLSWG